MSDAPAQDQSEGPAPVIFLDTNAVHYATLALSFASTHGFDLIGGDADTLRCAIRAEGLGAEDSYVNGAWIVRYLSRRCADSAEFFYSPVTGLELLCGGLKGEAVRRAAKTAVPYRWYTHVGAEAVREYLEPDGYEVIQSQGANVVNMFDSLDITLNEQEMNGDVWRLARGLMENLFIDVQDCLVYASALVARADELLTADGSFRKFADHTSNPRGAPPAFGARFRTVRNALINSCAQVFGLLPEQVLIPKGIWIPQIRQSIGGGQE